MRAFCPGHAPGTAWSGQIGPLFVPGTPRPGTSRGLTWPNQTASGSHSFVPVRNTNRDSIYVFFCFFYFVSCFLFLFLFSIYVTDSFVFVFFHLCFISNKIELHIIRYYVIYIMNTRFFPRDIVMNTTSTRVLPNKYLQQIFTTGRSCLNIYKQRSLHDREALDPIFSSGWSFSAAGLYCILRLALWHSQAESPQFPPQLVVGGLLHQTCSGSFQTKKERSTPIYQSLWK